MEIDFSSQSQLYFGLWEAETYPWMKRLSSDIRTAIDIGAAGGEQTLYFVKKTGAKNVYAFEPSSEMCGQIKKNLSLNCCDERKRIVINQKFVGRKNAGNEVALDSFLDQIEFPCFIKIDIDGDELNALLGAQRLIDLPKVRWLIETHSYQLERDCINILTEHGYTTKIVYNAWWRFFIPEQRPGEMNRWLVAYKPDERSSE
ncbi:FkbM family methyltransferase [Candidatus Omnitrophota bacterium]